MKKKTFALSLLSSLCLASPLLSSSSAFALAGEGVKVLKTKIVCKRGPCDAEAFDPARFKGKEHFVFAQADPSSYPADYPGQVYSHHAVTIENTTDKVQRYAYTFDLKTDSEFMQFWREIEVRPGGNAVDSLEMHMRVVKGQPGEYEIEASTTMEGSEASSKKHKAPLVIREKGK